MSAIGRLLRFAEIEMQPFDVSRNPSLPANRDRIPKASFHAKTYVFDRASRCVCPWTWRCIADGLPVEYVRAKSVANAPYVPPTSKRMISPSRGTRSVA